MQLQGLYDPFSFYNNPALWPRYHPSGDKLFPIQQTDANTIAAATPVQQASDATIVEPSGQNVLPIKPKIPNPMNAYVHEDLNSSTLGFPSPSSSRTLSMDNSNPNFNAAAVGLQSDLHDLLYGKNGCFGRQEGQRQTELDCFKDISGDKESMNWWATNGFDEKSSSGSWDFASNLHPDHLLQEYGLGYDL